MRKLIRVIMSDSDDSYSSRSESDHGGFDQFDNTELESDSPFDNEETAKKFQPTQVFDARITPGDAEKLSLLSSFQSLREDGTFCDVAFLCKRKPISGSSCCD